MFINDITGFQIINSAKKTGIFARVDFIFMIKSEIEFEMVRKKHHRAIEAMTVHV